MLMNRPSSILLGLRRNLLLNIRSLPRGVIFQRNMSVGNVLDIPQPPVAPQERPYSWKHAKLDAVISKFIENDVFKRRAFKEEGINDDLWNRIGASLRKYSIC